jgi:hypothetical protein
VSEIEQIVAKLKELESQKLGNGDDIQCTLFSDGSGEIKYEAHSYGSWEQVTIFEFSTLTELGEWLNKS